MDSTYSTSLNDMPRELIDEFQKYLTPRDSANLETSSSTFFDIEKLIKFQLDIRLPNSQYKVSNDGLFIVFYDLDNYDSIYVNEDNRSISRRLRRILLPTDLPRPKRPTNRNRNVFRIHLDKTTKDIVCISSQKVWFFRNNEWISSPTIEYKMDMKFVSGNQGKTAVSNLNLSATLFWIANNRVCHRYIQFDISNPLNDDNLIWGMYQPHHFGEKYTLGLQIQTYIPFLYKPNKNNCDLEQILEDNEKVGLFWGMYEDKLIFGNIVDHQLIVYQVDKHGSKTDLLIFPPGVPPNNYITDKSAQSPNQRYIIFTNYYRRTNHYEIFNYDIQDDELSEPIGPFNTTFQDFDSLNIQVNNKGDILLNSRMLIKNVSHNRHNYQMNVKLSDDYLIFKHPSYIERIKIADLD
jgi:hypothetical protein